MSTANTQAASFPNAQRIPAYNASGTDIPANTAVIVDSTNTMNNSASTPQTAIAVALPATGGNPSLCIGITASVIPAGGNGIVAGPGQIQPAVADGVITAGNICDASPTGGKAGMVKAHTSGQPSIGIALATSADGDTIPVLVTPAQNA